MMQRKSLSERELEILKLRAQGFTNRGVAAELGIAYDTVKSHAVHILDKLAAENMVNAVYKAMQEGLIQ
jgi:DNA-binding NarL/FixJ family response regulator